MRRSTKLFIAAAAALGTAYSLSGKKGPATPSHVLHWARGYDLLTSIFMRGKEGEFRERQLDLAGVAPGEAVLDVGCGTGTLALAAQRRVGPSGVVRGIDASPEMVARAQKKARKARLDVAFEVALLERLPFPDAMFDVVLSSAMLHHLPDEVRTQGLREIRRVLKPGGRLLAVDFGGDSTHRHSLVARWKHHGHFDLRQVAAVSEAAGLHTVESGPVEFKDLWFLLASRREGADRLD